MAPQELPGFFELLEQKEGKKRENFGDFNYEGIDLSGLQRTLEFRQGNFRLPPELMAAMEKYGAEVLDLAKKNNIDLSKTREFQGMDFNKDKSLDAKEVGAAFLAASMTTSAGQFGGDISARFDNSVEQRDVSKLLDPEKQKIVKDIAKQLLGDSGVTVGEDTTSVQSNQNVIKSIEKDPDVRARC